ncbi:hypothetical protein BJ912DRAFT_932813 [Pholiota molesta]|nr:hypothetical protein BJ912DRAFT_932813 [Pholiota molesta]
MPIYVQKCERNEGNWAELEPILCANRQEDGCASHIQCKFTGLLAQRTSSCKFTGLLARRTSSVDSLDRPRGTHPVKFHWIARAAHIQFPASARTALSHARVRAVLPYVRVHAATQRMFTAMALALAWDNAARALAWGRAARTRVRECGACACVTKEPNKWNADQCRASNPVNTHWNDSAQAIQWIFTGSVPREQSSECSLDWCCASNPVNVHRINAAQPSLWTYIFLDRSRGTMPVILCICHASGCAVLSDASAHAALPHARGRHSSGYPQDRSHGTDPVNIHWIARAAQIQ